MDSLLHIIGSLNIDLDEVTAKFQDIPSIQKKNAYITRHMPELKMGIDLTQTVNKQKFAKAIFGITQVMEGNAVLCPFRDDSLAASPEQDDWHRPDVPVHAARRIESHRLGAVSS